MRGYVPKTLKPNCGRIPITSRIRSKLLPSTQIHSACGGSSVARSQRRIGSEETSAGTTILSVNGVLTTLTAAAQDLLTLRAVLEDPASGAVADQVEPGDGTLDYVLTYNTTETVDYVGDPTGSLVIPAGATQATLTLDLQQDQHYEGIETIRVTLLEPDKALVGELRTAWILVSD